MGSSSRYLFFLLGFLFVLVFLLSSQVAPSNAQSSEHIDKKNGNMVYSSKPARTIGYNPRPLDPRTPASCKGLPYGSCIIEPQKPPHIEKPCKSFTNCRSRPHGEHIDKKNGNMVYSSKHARTIGYNPRPLDPRAPVLCKGLPYGSCIIKPKKPPIALKPCRSLRHCRSRPHGKAGEVTTAQFKDDFHN